jgi:hypothetical protein
MGAHWLEAYRTLTAHQDGNLLFSMLAVRANAVGGQTLAGNNGRVQNDGGVIQQQRKCLLHRDGMSGVPTLFA